MSDPDDFDSCGFADFLRDSLIFLLVFFLTMCIVFSLVFGYVPI